MAKLLIKKALVCNRPVSKDEAKKICLGDSARAGFSFDGLISVLEFISLVYREGDSIKLDCSKVKIKKLLDQDHSFCAKIITLFLQKTHEQGKLSMLFPAECYEYDKMMGTYIFREDLIPSSYSNIKKLFIEFNLLTKENDIPGLLILNSAFLDLFREEVEAKQDHANLRPIEKSKPKDSKIGLQQIFWIVIMLCAVITLIIKIVEWRSNTEEVQSISEPSNTNTNSSIDGNELNTKNAITKDSLEQDSTKKSLPNGKQ